MYMQREIYEYIYIYVILYMYVYMFPFLLNLYADLDKDNAAEFNEAFHVTTLAVGRSTL